MSRTMFGVVSVCGVLAWAGPVSAQYYDPCNPCACVCPQPVVQPCYRTVPVTEYVKVKQTVQKPVYETEYVDREFTTYEPVTETRTAEVRTVNYETVTEHRTVQRDCGQWVTHHECRPQYSPCQIDPRPGLAGWFNRTAYSIRNSVTPKMITRREYVPNVVAQTIPVTRQVPRYGTREVTYNVTRMVPKRVTQKVPVQRVRYVMQEIEATQPVTVMKTVQVGTRIAYGYPSVGGSTFAALTPTPHTDHVVKQRGVERTAEHEDAYSRPAPRPFKRQPGAKDDSGAPPPFDEHGASLSTPIEHSTGKPTLADEEIEQTVSQRAAVPPIVRAGYWTARQPRMDSSAGPSLVNPSLTVAERGR